MTPATKLTGFARPVLTHSVSAEIVARMERLIATGEIEPGDRLPSERELADRMRVSRTSLREAMHELEAKHLIERRPGRGTTVLPRPSHVTALYAALSDEQHQLRDVAELRDAIEPRIAEYAAQRATRANLLALTSSLEVGYRDLSPKESISRDVEFHTLVAHASQNPLMGAINTMAASWTTTTRVLSHATKNARDVSYRGHVAILGAITNGDSAAAGLAMRRHLDEVSELNRANLPRASQ